MNDYADLRAALDQTCHALLIDDPDIIRALLAERDALREVAQAALAYDSAIQRCANNPDAMSSFCTAEGDDLDSLYAEWISKARTALAQGKV